MNSLINCKNTLSYSNYIGFGISIYILYIGKQSINYYTNIFKQIVEHNQSQCIILDILSLEVQIDELCDDDDTTQIDNILSLQLPEVESENDEYEYIEYHDE